MLNAVEPKSVTEVKAFTGMVNYYAKFIPNLSTLLGPIYNLLKKDMKFVWTNECRKAFNKTKQAMTSESLLVHYNPDLSVVLSCDASEYGIGAVLMHIFENEEKRPVGYASRILTVAEKKYSVIQKEALAVFWGVKNFSQYLLGRKFFRETDHKTLLDLYGENKGILSWPLGEFKDGRYIYLSLIIKWYILKVMIIKWRMDFLDYLIKRMY